MQVVGPSFQNTDLCAQAQATGVIRPGTLGDGLNHSANMPSSSAYPTILSKPSRRSYHYQAYYEVLSAEKLARGLGTHRLPGEFR